MEEGRFKMKLDMGKNGEREAPAQDCVDVAEMISNLPVGICKIKIDGAYTLLYGNRAFYALYGYTPAQMDRELDRCLLNAVFAADAARTDETIRGAFAAGQEEFELENRIVRRDGSVLWGLVRGRFERDKGACTANCVVVDITDRKEMEEALRINEERFRIALAQTDNTIFDYDVKTKVMIHAYKSAEMYGLGSRTENVPESLVEGGVIHPDTVDVFLEMYGKIQRGAKSASCEILTHLAEGRYIWRRISMTNIFDNEGRPVRAVGILEDIDEQKRREEALRDQSERDTLTGLLNRGAMERRIRAVLADAQHGPGALFILDLDGFKGVNDRFGHVFGDKVLMEAARRISRAFYAEDIVGRIGGDEFMVLMKDVPEWAVVEKKMQGLCAAFEKEFSSNGIITSVFCSVGAAVFGRENTAFEELYQKADIALYEAKKAGGKQARLFRPGMDGGLSSTP